MGSSGRILTSADILDGTIVNADVAAAAAILASKLAAGGTANRVVATADGTTMALQQITANMIGNQQVGAAQLGNDSVGAAQIAAGQVGTSELAANAVTQMVSVAWSGSTTSVGTWVTAATLPSFTVTGGPVLLLWQLLGNNASASLGYIGYQIDSGGTSQVGLHQFAAGFYANLSGFALPVLTAGTYSIKMKWQVSAGELFANTGSQVMAIEFKK